MLLGVTLRGHNPLFHKKNVKSYLTMLPFFYSRRAAVTWTRTRCTAWSVRSVRLAQVPIANWLEFLDPDPLVRGMDPDPIIIKQI
jgi:hypothetical protein